MTCSPFFFILKEKYYWSRPSQHSTIYSLSSIPFSFFWGSERREGGVEYFMRGFKSLWQRRLGREHLVCALYIWVPRSSD